MPDTRYLIPDAQRRASERARFFVGGERIVERCDRRDAATSKHLVTRSGYIGEARITAQERGDRDLVGRVERNRRCSIGSRTSVSPIAVGWCAKSS